MHKIIDLIQPFVLTFYFHFVKKLLSSSSSSSSLLLLYLFLDRFTLLICTVEENAIK